MIVLITFVVILIIYVYLKILRPHRYWSDKNVIQSNPMILFGDTSDQLLRRKNVIDVVKILYDKFPNERYVGIYQLLTPTLMIRDPELIKQLAVKDADHFMDHRQFISEDLDPLWAKNLFSLRGQKWKDMRMTLGPAFTSSKMRIMFGLVSECAQEFTNYFLDQNCDEISIEMKDAFTRFTNDVIATTAYGIKCNSLADKNNEFYLMGKELTDFTTVSKTIKFIILLAFPSLVKILGLKMFPVKVTTFFKSLMAETIAVRRDKGIVRPDLIHILLEAQKGRDKCDEVVDTGFAVAHDLSLEKRRPNLPISDDDIMAQALGFFFAGFESVATMMCFATYELAVNPDIQKRLIKEVDDIFTECNGKLTYEALLKMKYLDMILTETLRKWPAAAAVDRVCTKPYTILATRPEETNVDLVVGDVLWLPIVALQRDPEYYPDPDKFDPERFNEENKLNINPYTYIPFGVGPRNCMGSRLALLETKAVLFNLLSKFEIVPNKKTPIPLVLSKKSFTLNAEGGFWLSLKLRHKFV